MHTSIEPLEKRIAPATFSYIDLDGDRVTINVFSTEPLNLGDEVFLSSGSSTQAATLEKLDLSKPAFAGKAVSFTVNKARFGDGKAHVGYIDATGIDLAKIVVPGDLGRITVGDGDLTTRALNALKVASLGAFGLATQGNTGNLESEIKGSVGTILVTGDVVEAGLTITGSATLVDVHGDLIGGDAVVSGRIAVHGKATVRIGGDVVGGDGTESGNLVAGANSIIQIAGAILGGHGPQSGYVHLASGSARVGAIIGGAGFESGYFNTDGPVESLRVQRSIIGGSGVRSGHVTLLGDTEQIVVRGSIFGGSGPHSAEILSNSYVGLIEVGGDLVGGSVAETGMIRVDDFLKKAIIRGSIIAGIPTGSTVMGESGGIYSQERIGSILVHGDMVGSPKSRAFIAAGGGTDPTSEPNLALGRVTIKGDVAFADIFAGILLTPNGVGEYQYIDADASIGTVTVDGNWRASNIVAGAQDLGLEGFGIGDALISVDNDPKKIAEIAKIVIKGDVSGSSQRRDFYGFVAQHIKAISLGGIPIALEIGPSNDQFLIPGTIDVSLLEVS